MHFVELALNGVFRNCFLSAFVRFVRHDARDMKVCHYPFGRRIFLRLIEQYIPAVSSLRPADWCNTASHPHDKLRPSVVTRGTRA
jgi:hypothetical protein